MNSLYTLILDALLENRGDETEGRGDRKYDRNPRAPKLYSKKAFSGRLPIKLDQNGKLKDSALLVLHGVVEVDFKLELQPYGYLATEI